MYDLELKKFSIGVGFMACNNSRVGCMGMDSRVCMGMLIHDSLLSFSVHIFPFTMWLDGR